MGNHYLDSVSNFSTWSFCEQMSTTQDLFWILSWTAFCHLNDKSQKYFPFTFVMTPFVKYFLIRLWYNQDVSSIPLIFTSYQPWGHKTSGWNGTQWALEDGKSLGFLHQITRSSAQPKAAAFQIPLEDKAENKPPSCQPTGCAKPTAVPHYGKHWETFQVLESIWIYPGWACTAV